ncbi:MAG: ABC transporter ATP-binding protein [Pirellulales bacterium]|nr:ABC transporter ATP-binding protein [Pirellulales bacterium]
MSVIEAINVTKSFHTGDVEVNAVGGISLQVNSAELLGIVGPSGSGKSTLLSLIGGIDTPTTGQMLLEGTDLASISDDQRTLLRRRRIGFVFQAFNLLPTLSALENVALPLELDGVPERTAMERAAEALQSVNLGHRAAHLPSMMSGGEQQRVAVARALVIKPALVLGDEPTGNLDSKTGSQVIHLFRELVDRLGQTVVIVTHEGSVTEYADRIVRLRDGLVENEVILNNRTAAAPQSPNSARSLPSTSPPASQSRRP